MIDTYVSVYVKVKYFRQLVDSIAALPKPFCPQYFTVGSRVRDKEASRIDDVESFSTFVDDRVKRVSGFDLIGEGISFGLFVGGTRNKNNQTTHVGCSIMLRGRRWKSENFMELLKFLCSVPGIELADSCRREEWKARHLYVKQLPQSSVQTTLGADMSASLPGLYWWTVFSDNLVHRHSLNVTELADFAGHYEQWFGEDGRKLHAFRLYNSPDDWELEKERITAFLETHNNFFSMTKIASQIEITGTKEGFDKIVGCYRAGATPWTDETA